MTLALLFISIIIYNFLFRKESSVLEKPQLHSLVFYRDYVLLTMIPYLYYTYSDKWESHYIYKKLGNEVYFIYASISAFIFIIIFLSTYKLLKPAISNSLSRFSIKFDFGLFKFLLNILAIVLIVYFVFVTFYYEASIIGLLKYDIIQLTSKRATLSQGGGFLSLNKIIIKSWIPMISYVYLYLYYKKNESIRTIEKAILILIVIAGLFSSIWYFEKSTIVFYLLGIVGIYVFTGKKLNKKYVLIAPIIILLIISIMYLVTYKDRIADLDYILNIVLHRTFTQSTGSVMALQYFSEHEFLYLSGISNSLASITGEQFQSPYSMIIDHYDPINASTSGAMSSFVTGEAYGLFGVPGVLISGIIVGTYYSFFEAIKNSAFLALMFVGIYGLYFSHFYVASSFYSFLWPVGLVYNILPFFIIATISHISYKIRNKQ